MEKGRFTGSIEKRWGMLDTHILGTMTVDPANGTRLEGETATLTRDLLLEVHRQACLRSRAGTIGNPGPRCGDHWFCEKYKRIEALPDYEDEG